MGPGRESGSGAGRGRWGAGRVTCRLCGPRSFLDLLPSRSNFLYAANPTNGEPREPGGCRRGGGVRFPILFARTLTAVSVSTGTSGPSRAPRGLGHLGPSHSPASVSRSRWARGLQAARPGGPRVWLGSFLCRCGVGAVGGPPLPSEGALRSLAGGVGRLARPRCPVSGWHRTVGGAAPQEMSAVRVAVPFGPLGGCALQGRKV